VQRTHGYVGQHFSAYQFADEAFFSGSMPCRARLISLPSYSGVSRASAGDGALGATAVAPDAPCPASLLWSGLKQENRLVGMVGYWLAGLWVAAVTHYYILSLVPAMAAIFLGRACFGVSVVGPERAG
jgi:hypothetical protein